MTSKNYEWYVNAKFGDEVKGKYVAIVNEKVVCYGDNAKYMSERKLYPKAKRYYWRKYRRMSF